MSGAVAVIFSSGRHFRGIAVAGGKKQGTAGLLAETGTYEMYGDNNKTLDKGKYVVVWKQENGQWKIYRDIWNTSMPAGTK